MSREQADQVALAVDSHPWPSRTATKGECKRLLLSGGIIPPDMALIRQEDYRLGWWVLGMAFVGACLFGFAAWWVF